jgi:hypothetical protein
MSMVIYTLYTQGPRFVESHSSQNRALNGPPIFCYGLSRQKLRLWWFIGWPQSISMQVDAEEGQGSLVGGVHDVRSKDVAFAGIDLDFAGEVSELAETD